MYLMCNQRYVRYTNAWGDLAGFGKFSLKQSRVARNIKIVLACLEIRDKISNLFSYLVKAIIKINNKILKIV